MLLLTGVDDNCVYYNDLFYGLKNVKLSKERFESIYNGMGKKALSIDWEYTSKIQQKMVSISGAKIANLFSINAWNITGIQNKYVYKTKSPQLGLGAFVYKGFTNCNLR